MESILLEKNPNRFTLFPIRFPKIWEMYKAHESTFWTAEELDLNADYKDFCSLTENEQHFIKFVLGFFAGADGIVNENIVANFCNEVQVPECRCFYGFLHGDYPRSCLILSRT